jgi:CheY-like chemotaxis protein
MARVRVQHWKEAEAQPLLRALRSAGHQVDYQEAAQSNVTYIRQTKPEAIVIDLSRSPAHGRELAVYIRGTKSIRHIPIVFVDGEPEKVQKIRELMPDAEYTTLAKVTTAVKRAIAKPPSAPVVPPQMMERTIGRSTAQKMGIVAGSRVALIDAPPDYARVLGELPEGVSLEEDPQEVLPVTVWFVRDPDEYVRALPRKRGLAARSKFWVVWPKGQRDGVNGNLVREAALQLGLVDYKICSVNEVWTAMVFAVKKVVKK